jgi:hypothetical protein
MTNTAKRYNLVLPEELYNEVQALAERRGTTVVEVFRRFIRLGLLIAKAEEAPDMELILRKGDKEQQLLLL